MASFASIAFHSYYGDASTEVALCSAAVKGISLGLQNWNSAETFRGGNYWLADHPNKYALTEWNIDYNPSSDPNAHDDSTIASFIQSVWQNTNFQALSDVMSAAYLYLDYDVGYLSILKSSGGNLVLTTQGQQYKQM